MAQARCTLPIPSATLAARSVHATLALAALAREEAGVSLAGPGWFESSWDLKHGLEVQEGLPADISVDEWLTAFLK